MEALLFYLNLIFKNSKLCIYAYSNSLWYNFIYDLNFYSTTTVRIHSKF